MWKFYNILWYMYNIIASLELKNNNTVSYSSA